MADTHALGLEIKALVDSWKARGVPPGDAIFAVGTIVGWFASGQEVPADLIQEVVEVAAAYVEAWRAQVEADANAN